MNIIAHARHVIALETHALQAMSHRLGHEFEEAVQLIANSRGRVVVVGMGKSGHIGRKIAATMASTGTPAFFVHPGEAFHGDLGMIQPQDTVLLISNSGETDELVRLLPFFRQQANPMIAMTGLKTSVLGRSVDVVLDISVATEACSNNLAPTSSTTATLVMGDALAMTLSALRGFQPEDFARFHPGGTLGRHLLMRVGDVMHKDRIPFCSEEASFREVVHTITRACLGLTLVGNPQMLRGIVTDGDIRRTFERYHNPTMARAKDIMCPTPQTVRDTARQSEAEDIMRQQGIHALVVIDSQHTVCGITRLLRSESTPPSTCTPALRAGLDTPALWSATCDVRMLNPPNATASA